MSDHWRSSFSAPAPAKRLCEPPEQGCSVQVWDPGPQTEGGCLALCDSEAKWLLGYVKLITASEMPAMLGGLERGEGLWGWFWGLK